MSAELVLAERRSGRRRQPWQRGAVCVVAAMMGTVTMKAERAGTTRDRVCAGYAAGSERYVLCSSCPPRAHAACAQPLLISAVLPFWLSSPRLSPPLPRFRYLPPPLPAAPCRRPAPSPLLSPSYASGLLSCAGRGRLGKLFLFLLPPAHLPTPSIPTASAPRHVILPFTRPASGIHAPPPSTPCASRCCCRKQPWMLNVQPWWSPSTTAAICSIGA